jgi:hypothetical protein
MRSKWPDLQNAGATSTSDISEHKGLIAVSEFVWGSLIFQPG